MSTPAVEQNGGKSSVSARSVWGGVAWWSVVVALLASAFAVDPFAEASFDAPKRLCELCGAALGSAALVWNASLLEWQTWSKRARWIAALALCGAVWLVVAALFSPRPELAWPALRRMLLLGLFIPLGASQVLEGRRGRRLLWIFALSTTASALLSIAQACGFKLPFNVVQVGGRFATGALLGNEGYVALACALLVAACGATVATAGPRWYRLAALGVGALGVVAVAINQQATSAIALAVALAIAVAVRWRALWLVNFVAIGLALAITAALIPPLRAISWGALPVGGVEGYQRLTTYRLGAWVAAIDMIGKRPLTGYGPGTFAAEAQPHRLAAELRERERFVQPTGSTFVYAHEDYLQLAAEAGIPALLLLIGSVGWLLHGLLHADRAPDDAERLVLLAMLIAGLVSALAWFPMQIPLTGIVLSLALGRAWRMLAGPVRPAR